MGGPAFNLGRFNSPKRQNDLAVQLKPDVEPITKKKRKGFETEQAAKKERKFRVRSLLALAKEAAADPLRGADAKISDELAALLSAVKQASDAPTFANPAFTREFRRRFLGEVLRWAKRVSRDQLSFYTLVCADWLAAGSDLASFSPLALRESVRTSLYRYGNLSTQSGWVIMVVDGEYDETTDTWQPHVHALVCGDKRRAFEALRDLDMFQGGVGKPVHEPIQVEQLENLPRQVSYLFKLFWPHKPRRQKSSGPQGLQRTRQKLRIPEPRHAEWLLFFNRQRFSDLVWLHGLEIRNGRLRSLKKRTTRPARS